MPDRHGDPPAPGVAGAVLAGGESRRMGRSKALLTTPDGQTWLDRALQVLAAAGCAPLLTSLRAPPPPPLEREVQWVYDRHPGLGPLAGLEAVLAASPTPWTLVVATDMPQLDAGLLARLIAEPRPAEVQALVPRVAGRLQPLHALYHRDCLPAIQAALEADALSLVRLVEQLPRRELELLEQPSFRNVNRPEEGPTRPRQT